MRDRKLNRLEGFDYSVEGYYFVTICTKNKMEWFGKIHNAIMKLNKYGHIVHRQWLWLSERYQYVRLQEFIIMPNHLHSIIAINRENYNTVGNGRDRSLQKIKSLSELIGAFKTTSSKMIHSTGLRDFQWQKSFFDHIIRNEQSLNNIREYIINNPLKWELDIENRDVSGIITTKEYYANIFAGNK